MIELQSPIKEAKFMGWQHVLKNLDDLLKCKSQGFGESPDYYAWLGIKGHNGIDIPYQDGTKVYASHDGVAVFSEDSSKGLGVAITSTELKAKTIYWHLKSCPFPMNTPTPVKRGQWIGDGDSTGFSTGSHLHFGLKLLDNNGQVLNRDNGYDGAVDPLPYLVWFKHMTEQDVKALQALEGYQDPDGVQYWTNKPLSEYLKARLADKVKQIQSLNDNT